MFTIKALLDFAVHLDDISTVSTNFLFYDQYNYVRHVLISVHWW